MRKFLCKFGIHGYRLVYSTGFTFYFECKDCGARKYRQGVGGYQPVDFDWIEGKKKSIGHGAPPKPPTGK